jgi:hypothetical protein
VTCCNLSKISCEASTERKEDVTIKPKMNQPMMRDQAPLDFDKTGIEAK